jgi:hypothetical protein
MLAIWDIGQILGTAYSCLFSELRFGPDNIESLLIVRVSILGNLFYHCLFCLLGNP